MLRKGRFALVDGKEYQFFSYYDEYYLRTNNVCELISGFIPWHGKRDEYVKKVSIDDFQDAYEIFPYVMLEGYRFSVEVVDEQTGVVSLVTCNPFVQGKVKVKPYRHDEYMIELPIDRLAIEEDKIAILGFENNHPLSFDRIECRGKNRL